MVAPTPRPAALLQNLSGRMLAWRPVDVDGGDADAVAVEAGVIVPDPMCCGGYRTTVSTVLSDAGREAADRWLAARHIRPLVSVADLVELRRTDPLGSRALWNRLDVRDVVDGDLPCWGLGAAADVLADVSELTDLHVGRRARGVPVTAVTFSGDGSRLPVRVWGQGDSWGGPLVMSESGDLLEVERGVVRLWVGGQVTGRVRGWSVDGDGVVVDGSGGGVRVSGELGSLLMLLSVPSPVCRVRVGDGWDVLFRVLSVLSDVAASATVGPVEIGFHP
jgi:hypothetical protein